MALAVAPGDGVWGGSGGLFELNVFFNKSISTNIQLYLYQSITGDRVCGGEGCGWTAGVGRKAGRQGGRAGWTAWSLRLDGVKIKKGLQ